MNTGGLNAGENDPNFGKTPKNPKNGEAIHVEGKKKEPVVTKTVSKAAAIILVLALSSHSLIEGIALGL